MLVLIYGCTALVAGIAVAAILFRWRGANSVVAWMIASSVVFINVGFLAFFVASGTDDSHFSSEGLIVTATGLFTASASGLAFHGIAARLRSNSVQRRVPQELSRGLDGNDAIRLAFLSFALLAPAWLYFYLLGTVPLFEGVAAVFSSGLDGLGAMNSARLARDPYASSGEFIPMQGLLQLFRNLGAPVVLAFAVTVFRRGTHRRPALIAGVLAVVTSLAAGQRWPLMYLILAAILAVGFAHESFPYRTLGRYLTIGVLGGVVLSMLQGRTLESLGDVVTAVRFGITDLAERAFLDQVHVPTLSYGPTGESLRGLLGDSYIESLLAYIPGPGASFPVTFYRTVTGDSRAYTAPPDFYTESYLNFGMLGVVVMVAAWIGVGTIIDNLPKPTDAGTIAVRSTLGAALAFSLFNGLVFTLSVGIIMVTAKFALSLADMMAQRGSRHRYRADGVADRGRRISLTAR